MSQRKTKRALVIAVMACIVVVIGAISGAEGKPAKKRRHHHVSAAQVDPGLAGRYGVLRRARGTSDHLPRFIADRMGPIKVPGGHTFNVDRALSRRSFVGGGRSIYVVPGNAELCLEVAPDRPTEEAGGEVCSTAAQARTGYMISTAGTFDESGAERVNGLVPDGSSVSVAVGGGKTLDAPVQGNVFSLDLPGPLRGVTVTEPDGTTRTIDWYD